MNEDWPTAKDTLLLLLMEDGFGPDEALAQTVSYARLVFGNSTPTAVLRTRQLLLKLEKECLQQ